VLLGFGSFFAFIPPEPVPFGLPGAFFFGAASPFVSFFVGSPSFSSLALVFFFSVFVLFFSVFCFFTSLPSAFSVIGPSAPPSSLSSLCSRFLLLPEAFSSTLSSLAFLTTSLPERAIWTAGLPGSAFFLMVLPRFDWMAISPCSLVSATLPPGAPEPQFHETKLCQLCGEIMMAPVTSSTQGAAGLRLK
jgi:hypothetical protein